MKYGVAIWHYSHRTLFENMDYVARHGLTAISLHGMQFIKACRDASAAPMMAACIRRTGLTMTVHHKLPLDHNPETVAVFRQYIDDAAAWQKQYGALSILSFDVAQAIRDNITPYVNYALAQIPDCKIAVEDFGLTDAERAQIEHLKANPRFGFLMDMGHLFIRMHGKNSEGITLFNNSPEECPLCDAPGKTQFLQAFSSKEFPIYEIHLHNNDGAGDLHRFIEDGAMDMQVVASALKQVGFDGVVTNEAAPGYTFDCPPDERDRRLVADVALWKQLWANG
jgi:sugar phosphate isomerase/epimerase